MSSASRSASLRFTIFKYAVFALLAFNIVLFLLHATLHEAVDSLGWVVLLGTFEYETTSLHQEYASRIEKYGLWAAQTIGYGLATYAASIYFREGEWLDFANAVTWLLVCAALAYDVYVPGTYGGIEWRIRNGFKFLLYALLLGYAIAWGYMGITGEDGLVGLLDFYDAALWIVCFVVVELNVFDHETRTKNVPSMVRA